MEKTHKKKHILIITYNDYPVYEGLGVRIKNLSRAFVENGFEVTIFAPNIENRLAKEEFREGCRIIRVNIPIPSFLKKNRTLARAWSMKMQTFLAPFVCFKYLRKITIHIIQAEQVYSIPPAIMIRIFKRAPVFVDDIGIVSDMLRESGSRILARLFTVFEKIIFKCCRVFIYTSTVSKKYYQDRGANPTLYAPNGVNCTEFKPVETPHDKVTVFFNCSTYSTQNVEAAVNFFNIGKTLAGRTELNLRFCLVCWPAYNLPETLRNELNGLNAWLTFKEGVEDIAAEIGGADILLLPYSKEHNLTGGVRLKALEYLACGKPIISTPEGVEGITGLVPGKHFLPAGSIDEIPEILSAIIQQPEKMKTISENARDFVLNNYDWRKTSIEIVMAYKSYNTV